MAADSAVLRAGGGVWHKNAGVEVRVFHLSRHRATENPNDRLKVPFEAYGPVPTKGEADTARFALGAVMVYQMALLYRHERDSGTNRGLKAFLGAA